MGSTKRQWEEELLERAEAPLRKEIAERLDLSSEELDELCWEVNVDQSKDGLIYGYFVNFADYTDPEILERLGAEDGTVYLEHSYADESDYYDYEAELQWEIESETHFTIFRKTADNIASLSKLDVPKESMFSLRVMLFMHSVSAIERLLQSIFLHEVSSSEEYTRRFVECDNELKNRPMVLGKLFKAREEIEETVRNRIGEILFHNVELVAGHYEKVFGLQLGNVSWLRKAVVKRHDCAHRAGYTKGGERIELTDKDIRDFLESCKDLVNTIEVHFRPEHETA